jgi:hypothetical protein
MGMEGSGCSVDDALARELHANAEREMALAVQLGELERNRWAAFTIVELEWISSASARAADEPGDVLDALPAQANAELERRARIGSGLVG